MAAADIVHSPHAVHVPEVVGSIVGLLLVAAVTEAIAKRLRLPYTVLLVVVGGLLGSLAHGRLDLVEQLTAKAASPEVILCVFLPTLIFESAFDLDARQLRRNLLPILTLAVPGLLLSTLIMGLIVVLGTPFPFTGALLLGAILSATDPVAVVALFKQLGAPARLTVLVEGESLFNDATALVLSRILTTVALAGIVSGGVALGGVVDFFVVFGGGVLVGWLLACVTGLVIGWFDDAPFIEVGLTTILAYSSFLVAEELLHVSGVMAIVAAGVTMGGWGRAKISHAVEPLLERVWSLLAQGANALIFLLVGLSLKLGTILDNVGLLAWVVAGMLISRAAVVYGLVPLVGRLPNSDPIDRRYQTVMYWGGLRGAIALAIVLSLPTELEYKGTFVALVTGAVLFTLLVQGLTIERLVHRLQLDVPSLADRLARVRGRLAARLSAQQRIPELQAGGLFSARIAAVLSDRCDAVIAQAREELESLRRAEIGLEQELELLFLRSLAIEKTLYHDMFGKDHLSEDAFRDLAHAVEVKAEAIRHQSRLPEASEERLRPGPLRRLSLGLARGLGQGWLVERLRAATVARQYEVDWGRYQASLRVLERLAEVAQADSSRPEALERVRGTYEGWREAARAHLDETAEQFPEFVAEQQERLAKRLIVHAESEAIAAEARSGALPAGVARHVREELAAEIRKLRGRTQGRLVLDPEELLRTVPFFRDTPADEFTRLAARLRQHTVPAEDVIIKQGQAGDSLFLIARGVVRVTRVDEGQERALATLMAGDFFGEMALLHREPRAATCRAVTPSALYELRRQDLDEAVEACPTIRRELEKADRERRAELG